MEMEMEMEMERERERERKRERENERVMEHDIEYSSDGEVMFTGPTSSRYLVVVDSEFPGQIQNHHFHPSHPLFLVQPKAIGENICNSCRLGCSEGIFYRCDLCDFDLDTKCTKLSPTIKYLGHPDHLLSLYNKGNYSAFYHRCKTCEEYCDGHILRCVPCNFYLHVDCLPHKVKHKNHRHFFTLTSSIKEEDRGINEQVCFECDGKINSDEPVYYCGKCYFPLHIGCSSEAIADHPESSQLLVGEGEYKMSLRRYVEEKTTELNKQKEDLVKQMNDVEVKATNLNRERKFLKAISPHKETSTKFPLKIKHPFHSQHPLTLTDGQRDCNCSVCMKILHGSKYHCFKCNFFLDLNCVLQKPTIKYNCHQEHLLIFLKKNYGKYNKCDACDQDCKASPILRCADCDFNLHIDCFPALPPTFKNPQCHLHTLTLTKSFAGDLSANEFYCDFCEDEGDPKLPVYVYYCEECSFFAHVTCVLYEELPLILAKLDSTKRDGGVEESVFVDISNDKIEDEVADEDPVLVKFDAEMRELEAKLEGLKEKRAQYLASVS